MKTAETVQSGTLGLLGSNVKWVCLMLLFGGLMVGCSRQPKATPLTNEQINLIFSQADSALSGDSCMNVFRILQPLQSQTLSSEQKQKLSERLAALQSRAIEIVGRSPANPDALETLDILRRQKLAGQP